jgi:RimJ/RimL family protein N-acetyltransferase
MTDLHLPAGAALRLRSTREGDLGFVRTAESAEAARDYVEQWDEAAHAGCLADPDCAHFVVEESATALPVGFLVLQGLERGDESTPAGILLRRLVMTRRGEGFGAQVLDAAMRHCFDTLSCRHMWLEVAADNAAARGLYQRAGFFAEPEGEGDSVRYMLARADWPATPAGQRAADEKLASGASRVLRADTDLDRKSTQDPADFE